MGLRPLNHLLLYEEVAVNVLLQIVEKDKNSSHQIISVQHSRLILIAANRVNNYLELGCWIFTEASSLQHNSGKKGGSYKEERILNRIALHSVNKDKVEKYVCVKLHLILLRKGLTQHIIEQ